ncbi:YfaP family protein [Paludisphaera rhizosphaerae]|uniref:YfaP family protein n=1 Tax=Paludisphaera rhizosphaerae TaxID=2711216 RepID=UPI0013EBC1F3|nr:hypothetical protein [Paludisphaera rhizosphaerae]
MSTPPQERREPISGVPIAYPPAPPRRARAAVVTAEAGLAGEPSSMGANFWTVDTLKSWGGSVGLHTAFLLVLAFWYFTPPIRRPIEFDSRLGGSPEGVIGGTTLLGGLNTPEDEPGVTEATSAPTPEPLIEMSKLDLGSVALKSRGKSSVGGGAPNDNPGAGDGTGFGLARFGDGSETIRGIQVKVGDPQFTLIWDTQADLDLHVIEPGGKEIYWEERRGDQGGELDVDNTRGFGPENIYWLVETGKDDGSQIKGDGPPGVYRWFVSYYGGFGGIPKPTQWQVRIKHAGHVAIQRGKLRSFDEKSKVFTLTVGPRAEIPKDMDDPPVLPPERP